MRDDLLGIVEGTENEPVSTDTVQVSGSEVQKFRTRKNRALSTIVLHIEPKLLYIIGEPTDPKVVWDKLCDNFQKKTWANKLRLKRQLYNMRLKDGEELRSHFKTFIELFDALAVIGEPLKDEDKVINLLASLPDKYSTLVTALEAMEKVPTWEMVTERLIHEENKTKVLSAPGETKVLVSKSNIKRDFKCFECDESGHIRRNCPKYKNRMKRKPSQQKSNVASSKEEEVILIASSVSALTSTLDSSQKWVIDSGATNHMTFNRALFKNFSTIKERIKVEVGDGEALNVEGKGDISLRLKLPTGRVVRCQLRDVFYVPKLAHNLVSVSQITKSGKRFQFCENTCKIFEKNNILAYGNKINNLYVLDHVENSSKNISLISKTDQNVLWHRRFCHINNDYLRKLVNNDLVRGLEKFEIHDSFCDSCCDGKIHRTPFPHNSKERKFGALDLIHTDVCGKLKPASLGGGEYFVTFIDQYSRYCWVYVIKRKSDVFETFKNWQLMVENLYGRKIKILRSDCGGEYCSTDFENYLKSQGIVHQTTIPGTPQQNGIAERKNRCLEEAIRSLLSDSKLSKTFWGEALSTANYVLNRCPSSAIDFKTPYEMLNNIKPNVKHLKVFGCEAFVHIPEDERKKLDSKSRKCIFLGYGATKKGYRLYDCESKKILYSRNVIFNEDKKRDPTQHDESSPEIPIWTSIDESSSETSIEAETPDEEDQEDEFEDAIEESVRRSERTSRPPDRYCAGGCSAIVDNNDPKSVQEAINGPDASKWISAMRKEIDSMKTNKVWTLTEPKPNQKVIKSKWIFKTKLSPDGETIYKARLVAQGFNQVPGVDYEETFSPVVRFESVRSILALSAKQGWSTHHMDVSTAFLNGDLNETLFMSQPQSFEVKGKEKYVCKLRKSIYGLKQSSKCWHDAFSSFLLQLGFKQSESDSCVYVSFNKGNIIIIALYVDDLMISSNSDDLLKDIKQKLMSKYVMKDLGIVKQFLGVNVEYHNDKIFIHQSEFALALLRKFNFDNAKPVNTPIETSTKLISATDDDKLFDIEMYQSAVGALLYLATRTRPDISFAVGNVSKFCTKPTEKHWMAVKRIFRYIKGTLELGIAYDRSANDKCKGWTDADWAGDSNDRKSTSGYCFTLSNGIISWRSTKQTCVALSTAEAEYVALASSAQEAVWLGKVLNDLQSNNVPIMIYEDNQSAICLAKSNRNHPKTKHIDIKYNYVRDVLSKSLIEICYCPTDENLADIFTKGLPADRFCKLRLMLGMISI